MKKLILILILCLLSGNAFAATRKKIPLIPTDAAIDITAAKTLTVPLDATVSGSNTGDQTNISGNAATVTTNANLTGPVTSTGNATAIASGAIKANMLQSAAADLGAADVTINLGNTNGAYNTNVTTDGTLAASNLSGTNTGDNAANSTYTIGSQTQAYNSYLTGINQALTTTSSPSFTAVGATTFTGALTGTASGNLPLAGGTMSGNITLGENTGIALDPAGSADEKWSAVATITGTAGATLAVGDLIYLDVTATEWLLADADAASTSGDVPLGICILAANDGDATNILLMGTIRSAAFPASIALGAPVYVSTTAGDIQAAQPTGTDDVIRRVGWAVTAEPNTIYFNPSTDYIAHV